MISWYPPNRIPSLSPSQKINLGSKASINLIQDLTPSLCYILYSNLGLLVGLLVYSFYDGAYFFTITSSCSSRWARHQNISVKLKQKTQKFHVEDASYESWLIHLFKIGMLVWELRQKVGCEKDVQETCQPGELGAWTLPHLWDTASSQARKALLWQNGQYR